MRFTAVALLALGWAAGGVWGQSEEAKARRAKINELRKQLEGSDEAAKTSALNELGGIDHDEARTLIAGKLYTDTEAVRTAAARAIARQRRASSAAALGRAIQASLQNDRMLGVYVDALAELDMCAGIAPLVTLLELKPALAGSVLAALEKIGCPDALPGLLRFLTRAEAEEKKPDFFEGVDMGGGGLMGGGGFGREENKNKNKALASAASKTRETMGRLAGVNFQNAAQWSAALSSGQIRIRKASVYLCTKTGQTYEVPSGQSGSKCPNYDPKAMHEEVFLKHKKE